MQADSLKRRTRVAVGIYRQGDSLFANYREPGSGRSRFTKLKATTLREAKKERASLLAALREGRRAPRSSITFETLAGEWLATRLAANRQGRLSDNTYRYDEYAIGLIVPVLGSMRVQDLTVRDVRRLLAERVTLAERTRGGMLAAFRQVMKMGLDEGLITRDPSDALQRHERPKQRPRRKGRRLSLAELKAVIATAEAKVPAYAALIVLLAFTGMRIREALGLRWQDVDLDGATIRLRWQLAKDDLTYVPLKTEAAERDLPILPALRRRLIEHRLASPWTRPSDPVFAATSGKPKAYRNARRALGTVADALDLDLVAHDFRRTLASHMIIAARADEGAVTGLLGHANIATTRRVYAADWREADERNEVVLRQLADAGIGQ